MTDKDADPYAAAILALHEQDRRAHLEGNADLLTSGMADTVLEAGRGRLTRATRVQMRDRFAAYFATVRYSRWDDIDPPIIQLSADARQAWMAVHIEAALTSREAVMESEARFESSWIAVYEKRDDAWLMVAISSSVVDRTLDSG